MEGSKTILPDEKPTIDFAYACVVAIRDIKPGEKLSTENIWVRDREQARLKPFIMINCWEKQSEMLSRKINNSIGLI